MSRSRKKHAVWHICCGNNSWYYKDARRYLRTMNRREMRNLLSHHNIELLEERIMGYQNKHNTKYDEWNEPTDGSYVLWCPDELHDEESIKALKRK